MRIPLGRRHAAVLAAAALAAAAAPAHGATFPPPPTPEPVAHRVLGCAPDQIDVNSASATQLTTLGLSRSVAERVIEHRQPLYLDLEDLLTVEGIGAGKLAAITAVGRACVDLPVEPPPTDRRVCVPGDGRVDVNRPGSRPQLAKLFGHPTAERIVAGIPYAGVGAVLAEHIPGAGKGKLAKLAEVLCATPPTIDHDSTRWGWISTAGGRVDHPSGGTLTVPAATVSRAEGAWGSVTALPWDDSETGPRFDMHIEAPPNPNREVYVTMPSDPFEPPAHSGEWMPTILHGSQGAEDIHARQGIYVGADGRLTASLRSLSDVTSLLQPASTFSTTFVVMPKETLAPAVADEVTHRTAAADSCDPDTSGDDRLSVFFDPTSLETGIPVFGRPAASWCAEGPVGNSARLKFSNETGLVFTMVEGGPADTVDVNYGAEAGFFERLFMEGVNRNVIPGDDNSAIVYGPAATVVVDLPAAETVSEMDVAYNALRTSSIVLIRRLDAIEGLADIDEFVDCLDGIARDQWTITRMLGCARQGLLITSRRDFAERLKAVIRALDIFELAATGIDALRAYYDNVLGTDTGYNGTITAKLKPVPRPPGGGGGSGTPVPGGGLDGTLPSGDITNVVVKLIGYHAELTTGGDKVGHAILSTDDYACITRRFLVRDRVRLGVYPTYILQNGARPAFCDSDLPQLDLPAGSRNFIMRELNGTSWLLDTTGHVRWIRTGEIYDCLAQRLFVIDNRSWSEITAFPWAEDGEHASCS